MSSVWDKLNLKEQAQIVVLNAPPSFAQAVTQLDRVAVKTSLARLSGVTFLIAFVMNRQEVDRLAPQIGRLAVGDAVIWFAYPKATSKRFATDIKRGDGWKPLGAEGFEGVRMIAIDEDWTAVRFRRVEYIKTLTRGPEHTMSKAGKDRVGKRVR